jgi:hypothetical protein
MIQRLSFSLIAATLLVAALLGTTEHASAQSTCGPPCGGDTTQWPWSYPPNPFSTAVQINGCQFNGTCCQITVDYRYREACQPRSYEIEILRIHWDRPCNPGAFDPVPIIRTAIYGILAENRMGFPPNVNVIPGPPVDSCVNSYTARVAQCWSQIPNNYAVNCPLQSGSSCCRGFYRICVKRNSKNQLYRDVQWIGNQTALNNCYDTCQSSCSAVDEDGLLNKRKDEPTISGTNPTTPAGPTTVAMKPEEQATEQPTTVQHTHQQ